MPIMVTDDIHGESVLFGAGEHCPKTATVSELRSPVDTDDVPGLNFYTVDMPPHTTKLVRCGGIRHFVARPPVYNPSRVGIVQ